jgi:hypothetical protein
LIDVSWAAVMLVPVRLLDRAEIESQVSFAWTVYSAHAGGMQSVVGAAIWQEASTTAGLLERMSFGETWYWAARAEHVVLIVTETFFPRN